MRSKFILAAALVVASAAPLSAQTTVTPFIGAYVPMRSLLTDTAGTQYFRMSAHTVYGARFTKAMSPSLGVDLALGAGSGHFDAVGGADPINLPSTIYFADLRARFRLMGSDDADLGAIVGAGWTQYSIGLFDAANEADEDTKYKGTVTGIVGLAFRAKLSDRLTATFDATDRIHEQGVEINGATGLKERLQHDMLMSVGLTFPLGG